MTSKRTDRPPGARKSARRGSKKAGLAPGSIVFVGEQKVPATTIRVLDYSATHCDERKLRSVEECYPFLEAPSCTWVIVEGLQDTAAIERLGLHLGLHPLLLEDIVNTSQRARFESTEDHLFCVLKSLRSQNDTHEISVDQISLVVGKNYVISFQESHEPAFDAIEERVRNPRGRHRKAGADYLAYSLLDSLVDHYFRPLEAMADHLEGLEQEVVDNPRPQTLQHIHQLKHDLVFVRKSVWPIREVVAALRRSEGDIISDTTGPYLADVYDHTIQVMETIESLRDVTGGILDTYLSSINNRMSEVMKVLTLIATVFIPLTFLAGVFGMNFEHMPELHWGWFYPVGFWIASILTVLLMVAVFRWKHWI
jgi:magnesium transporter